MPQRRIGIYSGVFDPVHAGHVASAMEAKLAAGLDAVYFLPERQPRHKRGVVHFAHRVAMLRRALRPHRGLRVLELPDISFTVKQTLPRLQQRFPKAQLVFLMGSDAIASLPQWPNAASLLETAELVVGLRSGDGASAIKKQIAAWPTQPLKLTLIETMAASVSSTQIRQALYRQQYAPGLLRSVERYSNQNWVYVLVSEKPKNQNRLDKH